MAADLGHNSGYFELSALNWVRSKLIEVIPRFEKSIQVLSDGLISSVNDRLISSHGK